MYNLSDPPRIHRYELFTAWLAAKGLLSLPEDFIKIDFQNVDNPETKYRDVFEQLKAHRFDPSLSAYFCVDDGLALYFTNSALRLGHRVPQDFSVLGVSPYHFYTDVVGSLTNVQLFFTKDGLGRFISFYRNTAGNKKAFSQSS